MGAANLAIVWGPTLLGDHFVDGMGELMLPCGHSLVADEKPCSLPWLKR
jgi:hypothetical protein